MTVDRVPVVPPVSARRRRGGLVALTVGVLALGLAWPVYQRGVTAGTFPTWVAGTPDYAVDRYSGPWIMGAFGLVLLAVSAFALAFSRLRRPPAQSPPVAYPSAYAAGYSPATAAVSWSPMQLPDAGTPPLTAAEPAPASPAAAPSPWARPK